MYSKSVTIGSKTIVFNFSQQPFLEHNNSVIFGTPINLDNSSFNLDNHSLGNTLKGYWAKIDFNNDEIQITNDILGGFRIYYQEIEDKIFISDNYTFILDKTHEKPQKHKIEYDYWIKHRFTTGQSTFIKDLFKISPASILTISKSGITELSYFKDISRTSNSKLHQQSIHEDLLDTFEIIKNSKKRVVLLFSGGKDSCLLLQYLLHFKIPFTPVFLKLHPISKFGAEDIARVRAISDKLNLQLEELEIDLLNINETRINEIIKTHIFDRHFSLLHFFGMEAVKQKFGTECLIINGQSSDSILSFGPSEDSLMSYFRRHIMYSSKSLISKLGLCLLIAKSRKLFRLAKTDSDKLYALFDEYKYSRVIDPENEKDYKQYIEAYIDRKTKQLKSFYAKEMYSKILSFCQGSDNQVVVNSSKFCEIDTIMPFATPDIIYKTIQYKDEKLEIRKPKYAIQGILEKEYGFYHNQLKLKEVDISDLKIDENNQSIAMMERRFISEADALFI